jgi:hypothetical protein
VPTASVEATGVGKYQQNRRRPAATCAPWSFAGLFADCPKGFSQAIDPQNAPIQIAGQMRGGVEVEWLESCAESVPEFYGEILPRFANAGPPDRTRLVVALWS